MMIGKIPYNRAECDPEPHKEQTCSNLQATLEQPRARCAQNRPLQFAIQTFNKPDCSMRGRRLPDMFKGTATEAVETVLQGNSLTW
jgi:hypothetical protein